MKALRTLSYWQATWLPWFPVTGGGWTIGFIIASVVANSANSIFPIEASLVVAAVVAGAVIGFAQWFAFRPDVKGIGSWMLASGIGWTVGLGLTVLTVVLVDSLTGIIVGALMGSLAFGFIQRLALRPETKTRNDWLVITVVGWTASMILGITLGSTSLSASVTTIVQVAQAGATGSVILGLLAVFAMCLAIPADSRTDITTYVRWLP